MSAYHLDQLNILKGRLNRCPHAMYCPDMDEGLSKGPSESTQTFSGTAQAFRRNTEATC
jgi:hypothetical protein